MKCRILKAVRKLLTISRISKLLARKVTLNKERNLGKGIAKLTDPNRMRR